MKKNIFLIIIAYLNCILCSNQYILEDKCVKNSEDNLISCNLVFHDDVLTRLKSEFIPKYKKEDNKKLVKKLKFEARILEGGVNHIKIKDAENTRYEIPRNAIEYFEKNKPMKNFGSLKNLDNLFNLNSGDKFSFSYLDDTGSEKLFDLFSQQLNYLDDFINFDYIFDNDQIFGYGERSADFKLKEGVYTTWPRDIANFFEDGLGAKNSYGHQTFFLHRHNANSYVGVSFLNSNAQDLYVKKIEGEIKSDVATKIESKSLFLKNIDNIRNKNKNLLKNSSNKSKLKSEKAKYEFKTQLSQITIGGILEFLLITGNTPQEVLKKYHAVLGKPILPNFWALGWHQSRWGFKNTNEMQNVVNNYIKNKIPIDTIWSDIDYMKNYEDFSYDNDKNFVDLPKFIENIKSLKMHFVPIIDMGIPYNKENNYYKLGKSLNLFINSNYTGEDLINNVWPGVCVYPDFTNYDAAKQFWHTGLSDLYSNIKYDGIWLDMNEPSGFNDGEILDGEEKRDPQKNVYSDMTYSPGLHRDNYNIETKTLSMNGLVNKNLAPFNTIYNYKPFLAFYQNKITNEFFTEKIVKRPFLLSRSSFTGMGRYSNHWLGDNFSTFKNMTSSISGIFNFQMFGFNLVGADICGFISDTTDSLCARWTALGAFYPFSRNHNELNAKNQEPFNLGEYTLKVAKKAIRMKYSLLRYFYTQLYFSSIEGGAFFQPLFFQWTQIQEFIDNQEVLNKQIMLGDSILFNPILEEVEKNVSFVFPNENWNRIGDDWKNVLEKQGPKDLKRNGNDDFKYMELSGRFDDLHLFLRGGKIIPFYNILNNENIQRTSDLENSNIHIIINPDEKQIAKGSIIYDDTDSNPYETIEKKNYLLIEVKFDGIKREINFEIKNKFDKYDKQDIFVSEIIILRQENIFKKNLEKYLNENTKNFKGFKLKINDGKLFVIFVNPVDIRELKTIKY